MMTAHVLRRKTFGAFTMDVMDDGVALILFDRPPVNAVSIDVYEAIGTITDHVAASEDIRAMVLAAPPGARAWCGGADLDDFDGIDVAGRKARYAFINAQLPRFYRLDRPVIAAISGAAIGIGMILAALCDMRIAAEDAAFACPEIDYGLVAGGAGLFAHVNMPEAKIREMLFSGARFTARELEPTGFFNYVLPTAEVLPRAMALARTIAGKSLPAIRARKIASARMEGMSWTEAYLDAQAFTAQLTVGSDGAEGVRAFLDHRTPHYDDR
ncbi:enoyl-CoA hydratase/carnithine racemase [Sphingobium xenophagum]|uniref:Enoyl-CoA hydratase/carnithine racemase n=1 Tax=Sphingobium xenophagum TaxID=121428 RepID=A0ABU1WYN5_SPHXE|nr:enoyl-CoA hydratase-related protein [Sphingobium xenophagum]MDR7154021.1 enoyl-CoA hydratase/carnithine racemase [Sphingobium xenophagum]